ncbi:MAG: Hsp20/alpha crystallin family protein [Chloroflexota bacterium]
MALVRLDPFRDVRHLERLMDRLWSGAGPGAAEPESWPIPVDVVRSGDDIVVHAAIPGVKPADIAVSIEDGTLAIRAEAASETERAEGDYLLRERRTGTFYRALRLPNSVDAAKTASSYANGVLTITLPKAEEKKARRISVEVKAAAA